MTDSQHLLAEYRQNGSDAAFRELVEHFLDLVHSTALRLVAGDTHRAQDVTQTVFVDLARLARTLWKPRRSALPPRFPPRLCLPEQRPPKRELPSL